MPVSKSRILGVDPAVAGATGYGVVEVETSSSRLVRFGALRLSVRVPHDERLRAIHDLIASLIVEFSPEAIAVESVFSALNVRTALKLAEVRGVILLAAAQARIPAHSYSPREVKASVTGFGAASKAQMQRAVAMLLDLAECPEPADAADALAIALCHAQTSRAKARFAKATGLPVALERPLRRSSIVLQGRRIPISVEP
jgi:crossover junction endodeoxyribonuclease RuvC